jgi:ribonuclease T1
MKRIFETCLKSAILALFMSLCLFSQVYADSCEKAVDALNVTLSPKIDSQELVEVLRSLNVSRNRSLPPKFVTKREARSQGWKPGRDLWSVPALRGSSIGGDHFGNRERQLPFGKWREADLDYKGGRRGAKRLLFSREGKRFVTVDHYRTFVEIPPCR